MSYGPGSREIGVLFSAEARHSSLIYSVQTYTGAPNSRPQCLRGRRNFMPQYSTLFIRACTSLLLMDNPEHNDPNFHRSQILDSPIECTYFHIIHGSQFLILTLLEFPLDYELNSTYNSNNSNFSIIHIYTLTHTAVSIHLKIALLQDFQCLFSPVLGLSRGKGDKRGIVCVV